MFSRYWDHDSAINQTDPVAGCNISEANDETAVKCSSLGAKETHCKSVRTFE